MAQQNDFIDFENAFISEVEEVVKNKTIWHTPEDYPKEGKPVLLTVQVEYSLLNKHYSKIIKIEGFCAKGYDSGEMEWCDWSGDRIFGEEKVIKWCELPE